MHVCKKRVIVDGRLAAFVGQLLTDEEAAGLGLLPGADEAKKGSKKPTKAELVAQAKDLGIKVPSGANVEEVKLLIADAQAALARSDGGQNAPDPAENESGDEADTGKVLDETASKTVVDGGE